jgi:hypothetical protein
MRNRAAGMSRAVFGLALLVALAATATAVAQVTGLYYQEAEKNGRVYIFNTPERYASWKSSGEMGTAITLVGRGANGETLVGENATALDLYLFKHNLPAYDRATPKPGPAPMTELPAGLKGLKIGTTAYLSYQDGSANDSTGKGVDYSKFVLKRGYIDVRKEITPYFNARITPDIYLDSNGNTSVRMKYLFAAFQRAELGFIGKPYVEFGMVHMPWLDFEENIDRFRMQDTMFMERAGLFNSADVGFMVGGNFGPELDKEYKDNVNSGQAGTWGSFALGLYNGGGYSAAEQNTNKVLEGRVSFRPIQALPGLQLSVFGVNGEGNVAQTATVTPPDWNLLAAMISYENPRFVLTGQYESGKGNQKGSAVDANGVALEHDGYSFFAEVRLDKAQQFSLFGRYDHFDPNTDLDTADITKRTIFGFAWQFTKGCYWLLDYDQLDHGAASKDTEDRMQLTLQVKY